MNRSEIKIQKTAAGMYDMSIDPLTGDLTNETSFDTDVEMSLFTDRRADASQIMQPEKRRGWFGDLFTTLDGYQIGSHLWLLSQARVNQDTVNKAIDFITQSLKWITDYNFGQRVSVTGTITGTNSIQINVNVYVDNNLVKSYTFKLWQGSKYA